MTTQQLKKLLTKWQRRLRLGDWTIRVRMAKKTKNPEALAEVEYDANYREADIRIKFDSEDPEDSLVHELLHVLLAGWKPPKDKPEEERTIIAIAGALIGKGPK